MAKKDTSIEIPETPVDSGIVVRDSGITVNNNILQPRTLPLIVTLPEGASKAQIRLAKIYNAYAYSQPKGWELKKERLLKELEDAKNAPDPIEDSTIVGSPALPAIE